MTTTSPVSLSINQAIPSHDEQSLTSAPRVLDLDFIVSEPTWDSTDGLVPRLPATRTPFPIEHLKLKLGPLLGKGGTGLVYEVFPTNDEAGLLPPIVIKVARYHRQANLAAEAWFYDELAALQGVSIPRCYGWFEAEIPDGHEPWYAEALVRDQSLSTPTPTPTPTTEDLKGAHLSWGPKLLNYATSSTKVSLLLTEKLGNLLPIGKKIPKRVEYELLAMLHEIALCGVTIHDIRYYNMLTSCPTPLHPNLPSPLTQRTYNWRVYDLESCDKTNTELKWRDGDHRNMLTRILDSLPDGFVVEPWEW